MSQEQFTLADSDKQSVDQEVGLLDLMILFAKRKKQIIGVPLAAAAIAAAVSFAVPDVYKASTKLLPPQQGQSSAAALLSQLGGAAGLAAGVAGIKNPGDLYVAMLKSRTIADNLIKRFELQKRYDVDLIEKTRKTLEENTTVTSGKDGLIVIEVEDEDQKQVAPLANAYVDELLKLTKIIAVTEGSQRRIFYENQLAQAKNNLAVAEIALKSKLDTSGVVSVDGDSRAIVETVGRLRAQISAKEVQLNSMGAFVTTSNPAYQRVNQELSSMRSELANLENGRSSATRKSEKALSPEGLANIKLLRDVKYFQMLYELLAKQYEIARLDEAKDPGIIQVLDSAVEPERKFKPKRVLIVVLAALAAFCATIAWAIFDEARQSAQRTQKGRRKWAELSSHIKFR